MSYLLINQVSDTDSNDNEYLLAQVSDLKGQLNVANLQLKDKDFNLNKKIESYELKISKLTEDNRVWKEKFEKVTEGRRTLEIKNSNLEDRLLKIVEKYESEQKNLFEELTIAHSKLVELKLTIKDLEDQKEAYRNDCNVAVNLLQCKPGDFANYSYKSLPIDLKERLKSMMTEEEVLDLEEKEDQEFEKSNSLFKLPVFQPSAAAAMMYNIQNVSVQREIQKQHNIDTNDSHFMLQLPDQNDTGSSQSIESMNETHPVSSRTLNLSIESLNKNRIAQILRKDTESPSKKSFKLFPYICLRCKKETVICEQSSQFDLSDLALESNVKTLFARPKVQPTIGRSHTVGTDMSTMKTPSYKKEDPLEDIDKGIFLI